MGDNFLEEQAKNSRKRRAKAKSTIDEPRIIQRGDEISDEFTIDCRDGQEFVEGEVLRCFIGTSGSHIEVARNHQNVGRVADGGGNTLRKQVNQTGVGKLKVRRVNPLTGSAQAVIVK